MLTLWLNTTLVRSVSKHYAFIFGLKSAYGVGHPIDLLYYIMDGPSDDELIRLVVNGMSALSCCLVGECAMSGTRSILR